MWRAGANSKYYLWCNHAEWSISIPSHYNEGTQLALEVVKLEIVVKFKYLVVRRTEKQSQTGHWNS